MAYDPINPGSCMLQAKWDFADASTDGKWSYPREVYRHLRPPPEGTEASSYDTGQALVITKNKVRGRGRALKLKFSASMDKDLALLGWASTLRGNTAE